jgi:O-antigen/teichoic acid export membrane protein
VSEAPANIGRRLARDTVIYGLVGALSRSLSFVLLPILTRLLTLKEYGDFNLLMSLATTLSVLATLGMDSGLALEMVASDQQVAKRKAASALLLQVIWLVFVVGMIWATSSLVAPRISSLPRSDTLLRLIGYLVAAQTLCGFGANVARWRQRPSIYLVIMLGMTIASGVGSIIGVIDRGTAEGAIAGMLVGATIVVPLSLWFVRRDLARSVAAHDMSRVLLQGLPFGANRVAELSFPFLLRLVLLAFGGLEAVGLFGAANAICLGVIMFNDAFSLAWMPLALSGNGAELNNQSPHILRLYSLLMICAVVAITLLAPPFVSTVLGHGVYREAIPLFGPLALSYWMKALRQQTSLAFVTVGRAWYRSTVNALTLLVTLLLAPEMIRIWGLPGVAWAVVGGEAIGWLVQTLLLARLKLRLLDSPSLLFTAGAFLVLLAVTRLLPVDAGIVAFLTYPALLIAFAAVLYLSGAVLPGDFRLLVELLPGKRRAA